MIPARNTILTALLTLLATATQFKLTSRRLIMWDKVPPANRPALFLWEPGEEYQWRSELQELTTIKTEAVCYLTPSQDPTVNPVVDLDNLLDGFDTVLKPTGRDKLMYGRQTLGDLVYHCRIEGQIVKASGDTSNVSILLVPIEILVPQVTTV